MQQNHAANGNHEGSQKTTITSAQWKGGDQHRISSPTKQHKNQPTLCKKSSANKPTQEIQSRIRMGTYKYGKGG